MKRVLAFLLLLAIGIVALRLVIGDEEAVRANGTETKRQPTPVQAPGVRISGDGVGASVSLDGPVTYSKPREVPIGDGRTRKEDVFILKSEDSRQIGDGLQQLIGVTMKLFDKGKHAATITAGDAFVELGRNANGVAAFDEQKKVDVRDCVILGEPGGQLAGMRLELGDATINISDDEVQLTTAAEQLVTMQLSGRQPMQLTGRGATARLPRSQDSGLQQAQVTMQSDPVLTTDDVTVKATGRMRYVENTVTGAAQISLDDEVELELHNSTMQLPGLRANANSLNAPKGRATAGRATVRGDQFTGWLLRNKEGTDNSESQTDKSRGSVSWQRLLLVGAPATVDAPGIHVATPRIMVRPGPLADPFIITAHGGESRIEQTELQPGSKQKALIVTTSPRRIHLVRPSNSAGALHRGMGFPQWTLRSLEQQQIVIYTGAAHFESGQRTIRSSDGLVVYGRLDSGTGVVQGFGTIEVFEPATKAGAGDKARPDLHATGSDGMLLTIGRDFEELQLGPAIDQSSQRWREHRYSVRYGEATVRGLGACLVRKHGERTSLELRAPFDQIEADFDRDGTGLSNVRNVRQLLATFAGEILTELDVGGLPVRGTLQKQGEVLHMQAPRLHQIGPRSLRLLPMEVNESPWSEMSELDRTPRLLRTWHEAAKDGVLSEHSIAVIGPRIDVHHAGGNHAIIDAHAQGDDLPHIYAKVPQAGSSEATTVTCAARRIRVLPFVLPPEVRRMFFAGATGLVPDIIMHSLHKPWLLVDDVRDVELDDEKQGHITGSGKRMFLSQGGKALLFVGDANEQTPAIVNRSFAGRTVVMQGARVRVSNDGVVRLAAIGAFEDHSTFLSPTMTLQEPGANGLLSNMQAVCRGNIQVDPDAVRFGGPVSARGLTPDGQDDPDGIHIEAQQLIMQRLVAGSGPTLAVGKPGDISVIKGKDVVIDWTRMNASAAEIELDVPNGHCTATDPNGAIVQLPDGRTLRSPRTFVNYRTWSFRTGASSVSQPQPQLPAEPVLNQDPAATQLGRNPEATRQEGQL